MDFSCLYKSNGDLKSQSLSKIKDINLEIYEYLSSLRNDLKEVYNTNYNVSKLIDFHFNKTKNNTNFKEIIRNNLFSSRGLNSKTLQRGGIYIKIHFPYLFDKLKEINKTLENGIYDIYYDIHQIPKCLFCGKDVGFKNFKNGYNRFCCVKCMAQHNRFNNETKDKRKKTNLERYGYEYHLQNPSIKESIKNKCVEEYGVVWTSQIPEAIEKKKQTNLERYGVENPSKNESIKNKTKQTNLERYGVESVLQIKWIHDRGIKKAASTEIKEKIKQKNLEKYGVTSFLATEECQNKSKLETLRKFGVIRPFQNRNIYEKGIKTKKLKRMKRYSLLREKLESDFDLVLQEDVPSHIKEDVYCECVNGHIFKRQAYLFDNNPYCPYCNKKKKSLGERQIKDLLLGYMDEKDIQCSFRDYDNGIENKFSYNETDILIRCRNIGIEFNGVYWHSERMGKDKSYHVNKTNLCEEKSIQLIHIFEDEWLFKNEICKSVLLSKFGIFENKIHGRKCEVRQISSKDKNLFLDQNHLQGKDTSSIKLGLFYNDELVSCMTFGKRKITGRLSLELIRFCNKTNTQIIGGANKLFKHFLKNFWKGEEIISYADRRWSNGNLYEKLGFELSHKSAPSYWYLCKGKRIHRSVYMKHKLPKLLENFNPDLTEWENMQINGFDRIWDCGCLVYKFN